jgi:hypothetical protein
MDVVATSNRVVFTSWSKDGPNLVESVHWDARAPIVGAALIKSVAAGCMRESQFEVVGLGLMVEHYLVHYPTTAGCRTAPGQLYWIDRSQMLR